MTPNSRSPVDSEDLSIRARRGDSTADELRALERALESSALVRTAHRVGRDFDDASRVRPGDEELVARAASKALSARAPSPRKRAVALLGIAAAVVVAASAAAATWLSPRGAADATETASGSGVLSQPQARGVAALPRAPGNIVPTTPEPAPEAPRAETRADAPQPATSHPHAAAAAPVVDAPGLFRDANAARRAGDVDRAQALYVELQTEYPDSREAMVSHVSLGKVLLGAGRAREAERQFRTYLAKGGKSLEEEALVGRADAFTRLGESGEERRVWEDLVRRHPSSVYAARARQRLDELGSASASERP